MNTMSNESQLQKGYQSILNADIGEIIRNLLNRGKKEPVAAATTAGPSYKFSESPYKEAFLYATLVIVLSAIFVYMVYIPYHTANVAKEQRLTELYSMQKNIGGYAEKIASFKHKLAGKKEHYENILDFFSNSKDLGKLYQSVTTLSSMYQMTVMSINEVGTTPIAKDSAINAIHVAVELKGTYSSYMQFKEDLSHQESLLHIEKESIQVGQDANSPGTIFVQLEFSTYAIDKKPFLEAIADYE